MIRNGTEHCDICGIGLLPDFVNTRYISVRDEKGENHEVCFYLCDDCLAWFPDSERKLMAVIRRGLRFP